MRVLITGVTGYIGRALTRSLAGAGHEVVGLSRYPFQAKAALPELASVHVWLPTEAEPPKEAWDGVDAVVNLVGEPIAGRWTVLKKRAIYDTRIQATRNLIDGIRHLAHRPAVLVNASATGYYGNRGEAELAEPEPPGDGFLAGLTKDWEAAAASAERLGVRVVCLRVGFLIGRGAPFLRPQLPLFRLGLGGPLGSGQQWWPWVHLDDVVGLYRRALEGDGMRGPVNATAPAPVRQRDFAKAVGRVLRRPALLPAPSLAIKLVLGEFAIEVLDSRRVLPRAAEAAGYTFAYTELDAALGDALGGS
ncbi:MAG: TIGR01777 family oxidoreductase [Chloroflexi bacterium]|nr:TIGR01777 family oxidoreductase [Chloroflexota bacterium]